MRLPGKRQESGSIEERGKKLRLGGQHVAAEEKYCPGTVYMPHAFGITAMN